MATLTLDFVYKYDIAVFLLTLEDAIDTSDFIFNVHDNEYPESQITSALKTYKMFSTLTQRKNLTMI